MSDIKTDYNYHLAYGDPWTEEENDIIMCELFIGIKISNKVRVDILNAYLKEYRKDLTGRNIHAMVHHMYLWRQKNHKKWKFTHYPWRDLKNIVPQVFEKHKIDLIMKNFEMDKTDLEEGHLDLVIENVLEKK